VGPSVSTLGIEAAATATLVGLYLDPGSPDSTVYPDSGDCPIDAEGSIGAPQDGDVREIRTVNR
jgi:enoyl reductase